MQHAQLVAAGHGLCWAALFAVAAICPSALAGDAATVADRAAASKVAPVDAPGSSGAPHAASGAGGPTMAVELPPDRAAHGPRWARLCSLRHPLCLRAAVGTSSPFQLAALAAADRAWDAITGVLKAPPPEGDLGDPWWIYLVDGVEGGTRVIPALRDPRSRYDRSSSFALVDRGSPPGCALDLALSRAVAAGSLLREVPATDAGTARAQSEALARLATTCAAPGEDDAAFQSEPARCVVDTAAPSFERGASLFFDWVDSTFGSEPGAVLLGAWSLSPTRTSAAAWRWSDVPTTFDVLRASLRGALGGATVFEDVLVRFAQARASMSPRPALAWRVPWPTRARRLAPAEPLSPTGTGYVMVEHDDAPAGSRLHLEAEWEDFARLRWVALKRDKAGRTLAELPIPAPERSTHASLTLEELDGVDHVLIIVQNVGSTEHAFNPDQGEWEPHGWLLTVDGQSVFGP